jgi:hypothetical protein
MDSHLPLKTVKFNKYKHKSHPWITGGLLKSLCTKDKLYSKLNTHKNIPDYLNQLSFYKKYRNMYNKLIRISKKIYWHERFESSKSDIKSIWNNINTLLNRTKNKVSFPTYFINGNTSVKSPEKIASCFNEYFINVGPNLANNLPNSNINPLSLPNVDLANSFYFTPTTRQEILSVIDKLKPKTSKGYDDISSKLVKNSDKIISDPLTYIINISFQNGIFPSSMKTAKVIPIYKSKNNKLFSNYRPISLLPSFSKIAEKLVYNRLYKYLKVNKLLSFSQYGFQPKLSTDYAILDLQDFVAKNIVQDRWCLGLFLDLSKAFDTLDHNILLGKLFHYGVRGVTLDWFRSYLTNRSQFTQFQSVASTKLQITCGVPQGSILGPLLFLVYMNDITAVCKKSKTILFADDTNMLFDDVSLDNLICKTNIEINTIFKWFNANKLSRNTDKTKLIIFKSPSKLLPPINDISINGTSIERVNCIKFLGVLIDESLSWHEHLILKNNQISKNLAIISRMKHILPSETIKTLYHAIIYPYMSYGIVAWGNTCTRELARMSKLQKRAIRLIANSKYNAHTSPSFKKYKLLTIKDIYSSQCCKIYWKRLNHHLPANLHDMLPTNNEIHDHNTRQNRNIRPTIPYRSSYGNQLLSVKVAAVWDIMPHNIKENVQLSIKSFSSKVKFYLIEKYSNNCNKINCYICQTY